MTETYDRLPEDVKTLWTTALRSGDFLQFSGGGLFQRLRDVGTAIASPKRYCCLGILACQLGTPYDPTGTEGYLSPESLSRPDVLAVLQQTMHGADSIHGDVQHYLAYLNDTEQDTFPEIADWIDANL